MPLLSQDIVAAAKNNASFGKEILTNEHSQLVLMSAEPGDDIGEEVHDVDQVLVFVDGKGEAVLAGQRRPVQTDALVVVPAGTRHNFINTGSTPLKLFTIYSPPEKVAGIVHTSELSPTPH